MPPQPNPADDFDALMRSLFGPRKPRTPNTPNGPPGSGAPAFAFNWKWLLLLPLLWLLLQVFSSFVLVGAGERAVIFNRFSGTQRGQLGEGLHMVIPWVQTPQKYDVRSQTYTMSGSDSESNQTIGNSNDSLTALTQDGLPVTLEMSVRFRIDPDKVWKLHQEVGPNFVEKIVRPQIRSHVRMVIAQYPVVDVYGSRRARIIEQINTRLRRLFAENDIILDEALLRDVSFSTQFQQAIEQKQVAQQDVQRMTFVLDQADKERRRKIIEAEGEAESIRLKAQALSQNPQLVQFEYVKNLPDNVRTIVTDGRTIVNLGDALSAAPSATPSSATGTAPTTSSTQSPQNASAATTAIAGENQ